MLLTGDAEATKKYLAHKAAVLDKSAGARKAAAAKKASSNGGGAAK